VIAASGSIDQALGQVLRAASELQSRLDELRALLGSAMETSEVAAAVAALPPVAGAAPATARGLPPLRITCFGRFEVWRGGEQVDLCQNRNGQAVLRYLVANPRRRATMDALMDALWPEDEPGIARHKLHVAVSALRRALNSGFDCPKGSGYLLYDDGAYRLNPAVDVTVDADELLALYRAGQRADGPEAARHYEAACALYRGPFLPDDVYADWSAMRAEQLEQAYLAMCAALASICLEAGRHDAAADWASACLEGNRCDEAAYRLLMRAHAAAGRRSEAMRQYRRCERVLAEELGVRPLPETTALAETIAGARAAGPSDDDVAAVESAGNRFGTAAARVAAIPGHA
jgi:LuxR family maltose regulon positive regulatory protein